jgi:hypothetical protein
MTRIQREWVDSEHKRCKSCPTLFQGNKKTRQKNPPLQNEMPKPVLITWKKANDVPFNCF